MNSNLNLNKFEIQNELGQGSFSKVYKIRDKETNVIYAAKVIQNKHFIDFSISTEISILSHCNHPSIIKLIGYCSNDFNGKKDPVIITEYLQNGTLEDILEVERSGIKIPFWDDTMRLINIYGIASAMSYLHSKNIIHCDLKPGNVLLDDFLFPKLSDFGLSKSLDKTNEKERPQKQIGMIGTASFIAPEILKENKYTKKSDVYAFGMTVFEIMTKEYPFDGTQDILIEYKVSVEGKRPEIKKEVPNIYKELIQSCWNQDPDERPSFDSIIDDLKNKKEFITEKINENTFHSYIENATSSFSKYSLKKIYEEYEKMMKLEIPDF